MSYDEFKEAFTKYAGTKNIFDFRILSIEVDDNNNFAIGKVFYKWQLNTWTKEVNIELRAYVKDGEIIVY